jgi:hypothetical protein
MKNKYNFSQVAQVYCQEIGVDIPYMEEYLMAVFKNKPLEDYDQRLKEDITTNSEYFPEFWIMAPQAELPEGFFIQTKKRKIPKKEKQLF